MSMDVRLTAAPAPKKGRHIVTATNGVGELHRDTLDLNSAAGRERFVGKTLAAVAGRAGAPSDEVMQELRARLEAEMIGFARVPPGDPDAEPAPSPAEAAGAAGPGLPVIVTGPDEHRVNEAAVAALASDSEVYQRAGQLVRVVQEEAEAAGTVEFPAGPRIRPVAAATLRERLTLVARWAKVRGKKLAPTPPPVPTVAALLERGTWSGIRRLVAVVEYPVMLPTGDILTEPGYDRASGLYLAPRHRAALAVPAKPTRRDAGQAAALLLDVVREFPFASRNHTGAWLAALLTPLARFAFPGCSPLFLVEGNVPGCGKGLLTDTVAIIVRGSRFAVATMPDEGAELRKLVTALLIRGSPMVLFDNVAGSLGGPELDALLTTATWDDRVLGESRNIELPNLTAWFATGNNVAVVGDTLRRVCPIRLESPEERPEEREVERPDLRGYCHQNRDALLSAALTILRAYHLAGRPDMKIPQWGSFEGWSDLVRGAVVWAGLPDPWLCRQGLREERGDEHLAAMGGLLKNWRLVAGDANNGGLTCASVVHRVDALPVGHDLAEVVHVLAGPRPGGGQADRRPSSLGYRFRAFEGRSIGGYRLVKRSGRAGVKRWDVERLDGATTTSGGDDGHGCDIPNPTRISEGEHRGEKGVYSAHEKMGEAGNIATMTIIPTSGDPDDEYGALEREAIAGEGTLFDDARAGQLPD